MTSTMTQRHRRTSLLALIGLVALLGITPQLAIAKAQVPFYAELLGGGTGGPPPVLCGPALLCIATADSGHATHLGAVSDVGQVIVDLASQPGPTPDCHTNTRTALFTGANGDQLALALHGVSCDTGATSGITGISHDTYVVTGGTGRFSGATGSGTSTVYINGPAGTSLSVFSGTVSSPGSH
jgi:hypothetical protein